MNPKIIHPDKSIALFVKEILVFESTDEYRSNLPFYADGYPGLLFQRSKGDFLISPHNKKMPHIFLYGQTITPITINVAGPFQIIVFKFYPFVLRAFWDIHPESINDSCYYLEATPNADIRQLITELSSSSNYSNNIRVLSDFLLHLFNTKKDHLDFSIKQAILNIIENNGQVAIGEIAREERLNIRTFERRFLKETGLTAKQFAKIVQFQTSLQQLTSKDFHRLTDIVYENGFSDQSHFIRVFKAFTGSTPASFNK